MIYLYVFEEIMVVLLKLEIIGTNKVHEDYIGQDLYCLCVRDVIEYENIQNKQF